MYHAHKNSNDKPRPISVISVCSGIGTDAVAWHPLGWKHLCFAEIEKFPSAVLAHHSPHVINRGDFTKIGDEYRGAADLLVGGTPCQSFSVAGLRGGLADDRGNLALEFLRLADRTRPRWVVWENVPGVLSSDGGRDFGSIIGGLGQLGYGWAYRILDAQYFGVPQRRRRVFVVGHLGDWRSAAAVLFERHSLQGNHPPRREKGQSVAPTIASRPSGGGGLGTDFDCDGGLICGAVSSKWAKGTGGPAGDECYNLVTHSLRADGFDASEYGTGRGTPIVPTCQPINTQIATRGGKLGRSTGFGIGEDGDPAFTLQSAHSHAVAIRTAQTSSNGWGISEDEQAYMLDQAQGQAVAFAQNQRDEVRLMDVAGALASEPGMKQQTYIHGGMAVRRLTPRECERLQGLPDDFTLVPFNGKPAADGPRYRAIGNGMAMPVLRWIGERIALVESLVQP